MDTTVNILFLSEQKYIWSEFLAIIKVINDKNYKNSQIYIVNN